MSETAEQQIAYLKEQLRLADVQISDMLDNDGEQWKTRYETQEKRHELEVGEIYIKHDADLKNKTEQLTVNNVRLRAQVTELGVKAEKATDAAAMARQELHEEAEARAKEKNQLTAKHDALDRRRLATKEKLESLRKEKVGSEIIEKIRKEAEEGNDILRLQITRLEEQCSELDSTVAVTEDQVTELEEKLDRDGEAGTEIIHTVWNIFQGWRAGPKFHHNGLSWRGTDEMYREIINHLESKADKEALDLMAIAP